MPLLKMKFMTMKNESMCHPLPIGFYFVRDSHRRFDYNNASQVLLDLMQEVGWLEDDCAEFVVPVFMGYHKNDKETGVYITLLNDYQVYIQSKYERTVR